MTESPDTQDPRAAENGRFFEKIERALRDLFERARARNELHFAFSLNPEFRGEQGPGWSTADDAHRAFDEYLAFLREGEFTSESPRRSGVLLSPCGGIWILRDPEEHAPCCRWPTLQPVAVPRSGRDPQEDRGGHRAECEQSPSRPCRACGDSWPICAC